MSRLAGPSWSPCLPSLFPSCSLIVIFSVSPLCPRSEFHSCLTLLSSAQPVLSSPSPSGAAGSSPQSLPSSPARSLYHFLSCQTRFLPLSFLLSALSLLLPAGPVLSSSIPHDFIVLCHPYLLSTPPLNHLSSPRSPASIPFLSLHL